MIYLATPYSHSDHAIEVQRFERACLIAGRLMGQGKTVFSPIAHTHPIAVCCALPRDWEFWRKYDTEMLRACDELIVVKMKGWDTSKGVSGEVDTARRLGIPVSFMEDPYEV